MIARVQWYWPRDVAALLGVSRQTVHRWIRDGILRAHNINVGQGRPNYRVSPESVVEFMAGKLGMTDDEIARTLGG